MLNAITLLIYDKRVENASALIAFVVKCRNTKTLVIHETHVDDKKDEYGRSLFNLLHNLEARFEPILIFRQYYQDPSMKSCCYQVL